MRYNKIIETKLMRFYVQKNATRNFTVLSLFFSMCMPCAFSSANQAEEICVEQDNLATQQTEEGQKQKKLNEMAIDLFSMMFGGSREKQWRRYAFSPDNVNSQIFLPAETNLKQILLKSKMISQKWKLLNL